ncbi:MAG TPA: hypothetical protein VFJ12_15975 [Segeticoccus sp.]|nr:hypothetical protein [Segeticoccus sp.]
MDNDGEQPRPTGATDEDRLIIEALTEHRMADWHAERGDVSAAEKAYRAAADGFAGAGDRLGAARATHALGILQHQQGRDEDAERTLVRAGEAFAAAGSPDGAARSHWARARIADGRGDEAAVQLYTGALDLFAEAQEQLHLDAGQPMTECLVALGLLHHRLGQQDEALHALDTVLGEAASRQSSSSFFSSGTGPEPLTVPHLEEVVSVHSSLLRQRGLVEEAWSALRDVLRLKDVRQDGRLRGLVHHEVGSLSLQLERRDAAAAEFEQAREALLPLVGEDASVLPTLAEAEFNLAVLGGQAGNVDRAVELARSAEQRFGELDSTDMAAEAAFLAGTALFHGQRPEDAVREYRRAADLHDQAGNAEAAERSRTAAEALAPQDPAVPDESAQDEAAHGERSQPGTE